MRRRDLLAVLGGAAVAAPVAARAQQKAMPVISYLAPDAPSASASGIAAWREGLAQSGFLEGRNVVVEYRSGSGDYGRMPALAAELVGQHVDLLMASSLPAAVAAKSATSRMPIVFWVGWWLSAWCRASIGRGAI
jgi:putative ABC transport system substrate-binding protein